MPTCTRCSKPVKNRVSTPRKTDGTGQWLWFCKKCWKKLGGYA